LSESEHDEESENQPPVKKQKIFCEYAYVQDFDTLELAKRKQRKQCNYWVKQESMTGTKIYCKCKRQPCTLKAFLELKGNV